MKTTSQENISQERKSLPNAVEWLIAFAACTKSTITNPHSNTIAKLVRPIPPISPPLESPHPLYSVTIQQGETSKETRGCVFHLPLCIDHSTYAGTFPPRKWVQQHCATNWQQTHELLLTVMVTVTCLLNNTQQSMCVFMCALTYERTCSTCMARSHCYRNDYCTRPGHSQTWMSRCLLGHRACHKFRPEKTCQEYMRWSMDVGVCIRACTGESSSRSNMLIY